MRIDFQFVGNNLKITKADMVKHKDAQTVSVEIVSDYGNIFSHISRENMSSGSF